MDLANGAFSTTGIIVSPKNSLTSYSPVVGFVVPKPGDTPAWEARVGLHAGSLAQVPTVNLGPWGRDYHTPLERLHAAYAFDTLPRVLLAVIDAVAKSG